MQKHKNDYCGECLVFPQAELELRTMMAAQSNARVLLQAIDNGLFPKSMLDNIDNGSPCGFIHGTTEITSELLVPSGELLLTITGKFFPGDSLPVEDVLVTLYGVDSVHGSSKLTQVNAVPPYGMFNIVLTDPLPGYIPYILAFTPNNCTAYPPSPVSTNSFGTAIIYVENQNEFSTAQMTATLTWDDEYSDVDLHILEPGDNGTHVYFGNDVGISGELDIDDMYGWGPEHFFSKAPATGVYKFYVNMYSRQAETATAPPVTWTLSLRIGTTVAWTESGTFSDPVFSNSDSRNFAAMAGPFEFDTSVPFNQDGFNNLLFRVMQEFRPPQEH